MPVPGCTWAELWFETESCAVTDQNARTYSWPPWVIVGGADGDETQLSAIGEAVPELWTRSLPPAARRRATLWL